MEEDPSAEPLSSPTFEEHNRDINANANDNDVLIMSLPPLVPKEENDEKDELENESHSHAYASVSSFVRMPMPDLNDTAANENAIHIQTTMESNISTIINNGTELIMANSSSPPPNANHPTTRYNSDSGTSNHPLPTTKTTQTTITTPSATLLNESSYQQRHPHSHPPMNARNTTNDDNSGGNSINHSINSNSNINSNHHAVLDHSTKMSIPSNSQSIRPSVVDPFMYQTISNNTNTTATATATATTTTQSIAAATATATATATITATMENHDTNDDDDSDPLDSSLFQSLLAPTQTHAQTHPSTNTSPNRTSTRIGVTQYQDDTMQTHTRVLHGVVVVDPNANNTNNANVNDNAGNANVHANDNHGLDEENDPFAFMAEDLEMDIETIPSKEEGEEEEEEPVVEVDVNVDVEDVDMDVVKKKKEEKGEIAVEMVIPTDIHATHVNPLKKRNDVSPPPPTTTTTPTTSNNNNHVQENDNSLQELSIEKQGLVLSFPEREESQGNNEEVDSTHLTLNSIPSSSFSSSKIETSSDHEQQHQDQIDDLTIDEDNHVGINDIKMESVSTSPVVVTLSTLVQEQDATQIDMQEASAPSMSTSTDLVPKQEEKDLNIPSTSRDEHGVHPTHNKIQMESDADLALLEETNKEIAVEESVNLEDFFPDMKKRETTTPKNTIVKKKRYKKKRGMSLKISLTLSKDKIKPKRASTTSTKKKVIGLNWMHAQLIEVNQDINTTQDQDPMDFFSETHEQQGKCDHVCLRQKSLAFSSFSI